MSSQNIANEVRHEQDPRLVGSRVDRSFPVGMLAVLVRELNRSRSVHADHLTPQPPLGSSDRLFLSGNSTLESM
jgi:hypothetical protein